MKKHRTTRIGAILAPFLLGAGLMLPGWAQADASPWKDVQGHWAQKQIEDWVKQGLAKGYGDGIFKPNKSITRAEFMTLANKALGYTEKSDIDFKDVQSDQWFYEEIQKAYSAGYISGYEDETIRPNQQVTRQEVAAMLAKMKKLESSSDEINPFADKASLPAWSKGLIGAVVKKGYMSGYPDQSFKPSKPITRAEAISTLDRVITKQVKTLFDQAGSYGPETGLQTIQGDIVISVSGVQLKNTVIKGNLLLAEGIGEGDVTLENVTVTGETTVKGGGAHSVVLKDSKLETIIVSKKQGLVRIVASGKTEVNQMKLESAVKLEESGLTAEGFEDVILLDKLPENATLYLVGQFGQVDVKSPNITIELAQDSKIAALTLDAAVKVTGKGTVDLANINVKGSSMEKTPVSLKLANDVTVTIEGKEVTQSATIQTGGAGGGAAPTTPPATVEAPTVTFNVPGATRDSGNPNVFRIPGTTDQLILVADVNVASEVKIVSIKNASNQEILSNLQQFKPSLGDTRDVPAGPQEYRMSADGVPVSFVSALVGGSMDVTIRMANAEDKTKAAEYTVKIIISD